MIFIPGQRLGRYTIERLLGEGAMGRVYQARDHDLERAVALKVLKLDEEASSEDRARGAASLLREARAVATLDHANAVTIHDVGELEGQPFLAMELVDGTSLRSYVGDPSIPLETRVRWLTDVARALEAAHARGLIHRDVKPENVMLRRDGVIKVLDFGIARRAQAEDTPRSNDERPAGDLGTLEGSIVGTPQYMAPEQLRGEPIDERADQFAWGVMAYELLVGQPPWSGSAASFTLLATIVSDDVVPMDRLEESCPPHLVAVVARVLAKHREARFPSMTAVVAALATDAPARPRPWRRRAGVAGALVLALGLGVAALRLRPAPVPGIDTPARMTDFTALASENPAARSAYIEGLSLLHEGSVAPGVQAMLRALAADPDAIEARVRLLAFGRGLGEVDERLHFEKVWPLRARLSLRDRQILEALSPLYLTVPADQATTTSRLAALAAARPRDAEISYLSAAREDDPARIVDALTKVIAIDPEFSLVLWRRSATQLVQGRFDDALAGLDRCIELSPGSTACRSVRLLIDEETGRCEAMEKDARILEARTPSARTHDWVARALLARGAPLASVRDVLLRKWRAANDKERVDYQLIDEQHLAEAAGDFVTAEARAKEREARVASSLVEDDHKAIAWEQVELYTEMGEPARAAALADGYLAARSAWQTDGPWAVEPVFFAAALHGGLRTEEARVAARERWLKSWDAEPLELRNQGWLLGWAEPAQTEEEGREAMRVAPKELPRPHTNQFNRTSIGTVGKVLLLAGRDAEALPQLRQAAATCSLLPAPLAQTRAHLLLGEVLARTGDVAGACASFEVVLARWGNAKPRSISAEQARERSAALGCHH